MIDQNAQPLDVAKRILQPSTIEAVKRSAHLRPRAWSILDRLATSDPASLLALERGGAMALVHSIYRQQEAESLALASLDDVGHLAEHEKLALASA